MLILKVKPFPWQSLIGLSLQISTLSSKALSSYSMWHSLTKFSSHFSTYNKKYKTFRMSRMNLQMNTLNLTCWIGIYHKNYLLGLKICRVSGMASFIVTMMTFNWVVVLRFFNHHNLQIKKVAFSTYAIWRNHLCLIIKK